MRKTQNGITNGWLYLIGLVALLLLALALVVAANRHDAAIDKRAYARGQDACRATYTQRDADALSAANARIQALETAAREAETKATKRQADVADHYRKDKADATAKNARVIDDLRDGNTRLYVELANANSAAGSRPSAGATAAAGTGGPDGTGSAGFLRPADATFLAAEAGRADDIVRRLTACQTIIADDRATVNR